MPLYDTVFEKKWSDVVSDSPPQDVIDWVRDEGGKIAVAQIDSDTDAIYGAVLGNRAQEYLDAEVAAQVYKDAGYTGTVPDDVQCYATAKGWTAQQAADDILATAAAWRPAKSSIRANRLAAKEAVRDSLTISEVEAVLAWWVIFVVAIRTQLGI